MLYYVFYKIYYSNNKYDPDRSLCADAKFFPPLNYSFVGNFFNRDTICIGKRVNRYATLPVLLTFNDRCIIQITDISKNFELTIFGYLIDRYLKDVADARAREVAVVQATGKKDINLYMLAWTFVVGFFVAIITMMVLVLSGKMPDNMPQYVVFLLGSLFGTFTSGVTAIIQYFFGSSKGSHEKTEMMVNNLMKR